MGNEGFRGGEVGGFWGFGDGAVKASVVVWVDVVARDVL